MAATTTWFASSNIASYTPYSKVFGHCHMAKTAGTEINGELATHYERVCGHKGYSYDAVQFNERVKNMVQSTGVTNLERLSFDDLISYKYKPKPFNRGRVPPDVMREIGFEDCDYVSLESHWEFWKEIASLGPVELHVPCRDPLEHFMSQCNHRRRKFTCEDSDTDTTLWDQIDACLISMGRFNISLTRIDQLQLKCFNPIPITPYLEYMDHFLQRKRIQTPYVHRESNTPRDKSTECIWENKAIADRVVKYLMGHDYYLWCQGCMGTENELLMIRP